MGKNCSSGDIDGCNLFVSNLFEKEPSWLKKEQSAKRRQGNEKQENL